MYPATLVLSAEASKRHFFKGLTRSSTCQSHPTYCSTNGEATERIKLKSWKAQYFGFLFNKSKVAMAVNSFRVMLCALSMCAVSSSEVWVSKKKKRKTFVLFCLEFNHTCIHTHMQADLHQEQKNKEKKRKRKRESRLLMRGVLGIIRKTARPGVFLKTSVYVGICSMFQNQDGSEETTGTPQIDSSGTKKNVDLGNSNSGPFPPFKDCLWRCRFSGCSFS